MTMLKNVLAIADTVEIFSLFFNKSNGNVYQLYCPHNEVIKIYNLASYLNYSRDFLIVYKAYTLIFNDGVTSFSPVTTISSFENIEGT